MTTKEALKALAVPEPDVPLYGNPKATKAWGEWNRRRLEALKAARG